MSVNTSDLKSFHYLENVVNGLNNLQPLWKSENRSKFNKF